MKDNELRGLALQAFYDRRKLNDVEPPTTAWVDGKASSEDLFRICKQLGDHGLLDWHQTYESGAGSITTLGIDVIEGERQPEIALKLVQNFTNNSITNSSNAIIGSNNSQSVSSALFDILRAIEESPSDDASKNHSKSLLAQFAGSPVMAQIIGQLTKFGLDRFL